MSDAADSNKDAPSDRTLPDERHDAKYRKAARLLGQKLGVDWHSLDPEAVREYMRKIEIARKRK